MRCGTEAVLQVFFFTFFSSLPQLTNTLLAEVEIGNLDSVIKLVTDSRVSKKISYRFRNEEVSFRVSEGVISHNL